MPATETSNVKTILIVVVAAIVVAVVVTLIQSLLLGKANVAVTGGVVGATVGGLGFSLRRKKSS